MKNQKHIREFEDYLTSNNSSKSTIKSYIRTIKQFLELIDKKSEDINEKEIERYKLHAHTKILRNKYIHEISK